MGGVGRSYLNETPQISSPNVAQLDNLRDTSCNTRFDMVEVASSNLAGPTKFVSLCFTCILFFVIAESARVVASYLYLRKVALKEPHCLTKVLQPCDLNAGSSLNTCDSYLH